MEIKKVARKGEAKDLRINLEEVFKFFVFQE
jgi:hypothetical protein